MASQAKPSVRAVLEAFEAGPGDASPPDRAGYLPERTDSDYLQAARDLIRVDIEICWHRGEPKQLESYRDLLPEVFADRASLEELTAVELRLRRQAGENPSPEEYEQRFGVCPRTLISGAGATNGNEDVSSQADAVSEVLAPTIHLNDLRLASVAYQAFRKRRVATGSPSMKAWYASLSCKPEYADLYCHIHSSDPEAASRLAMAVTAMPHVGCAFLEFQLVAELGHGAFARVFLAQQTQLADRLVVLKISSDPSDESQNLARLQHTNIVPIYSVHSIGTLTAVCMPYFGATTLLDVYKDLKSLPRLPDSGKGLISTLNARKSTVVGDGARRALSDSAAASRPPFGSAGKETVAVATVPTPTQSPHTLKLFERFSYVEAVLWLGARLADGLAYAHERGICHRDLKPANILLTDEGQPMLLDFNLAVNSKVRNNPSGAVIGGTLPYMAPEHLEAFRGGTQPVDGRGDIYALGIILFELLSRRHPFQPLQGPMRNAIPEMIEERRQPPPSLRRWNPTLPPAVESVVRHCLEGDPERRYPSARELQEDLERLLDHRPLKFAPDPSLLHRGRRWLRRHPIVTRSVAVGVLVFFIAMGAGWTVQAQHEKQRRRAEDVLQEFRSDKPPVQYLLLVRRNNPSIRGAALRECARCLSRYQVFQNPSWHDLPSVRSLHPEKAEKLREEIGELLLLYVRNLVPDASTLRDADERARELREALQINRRAEACFAADQAPSFLWRQRADLYDKLGDPAEAKRCQDRAERPPDNLLDLYLNALELQLKDRWADAIKQYQQVTARAPDHYWAWFMQGVCLDYLGDYAEAEGCFSVCIVLWPEKYWAYFNRGVQRLHMKRWELARQDINLALDTCEDREQQADLYYNRGNCQVGLGDDPAAVEDFTRALDRGAPYTRLYFARAEARRRLGQYEEARRDHQEGMKRTPTDTLSWTTRGLKKLEANPPDFRGAVEDFRRALATERKNLRAWQNAAHTLSAMGAAEEAVRCLTKALDFYPHHREFRSGRGVELARLGRRDEAYRDAAESLRNAPPASIVYQVAGIYALNSQQDPHERRKSLLLCSALLRPPAVVEQVAVLGAVYEGEAADKRRSIVQLVPCLFLRGTVLHQTAGMHAVLSQRNGADRRKALALLAEALQKGFGMQELESDPELNPIRDQVEFCQLIQAVRDLQAAIDQVRR